MSAKSLLVTGLTIFAVVALIGNVAVLRNVAIPATPRIGG